MISSETPDKLREIIMDTWPQLFRPHAKKNHEKTYPPSWWGDRPSK